jgi:hypothetical protein
MPKVASGLYTDSATYCTWDICIRVKASRMWIDYSDSCSAESKNEWNFTSSPIWLIGMNRENFTFNHLLGTQEHKQLLEYFHVCLICFCHSDLNYKNCVCAWGHEVCYDCVIHMFCKWSCISLSTYDVLVNLL